MARMGFLLLDTLHTDTLFPVHGSSPQPQHANTHLSSGSGKQGERESEFTSSCSSGHTAQDFSKYQVDGEDEPLGSGVRETCIQIPLSICTSVTSSKTLHISGPSFSKNCMRIITLPTLWPVMTMKLKKKVSVEFCKSLTPGKPHPITREIRPSILFHWLVKKKQVVCVEAHCR